MTTPELRDGLPLELADRLEKVSRNCGYWSDYQSVIEEAGWRLIPWQADVEESSVMGALQMLVRALRDEPLRTLGRKDNGAAWSQWFNSVFTPAWAYALMASGLHRDDPSLRRVSEKDRADYLAALEKQPRLTRRLAVILTTQ